MVKLFIIHMPKSLKLLYLCLKMIAYFFLILILECCIMSINLNNYPLKIMSPNLKMTVPIWMYQLLKILLVQMIFKYNLLWKIKKIKILTFNGFLPFKIKYSQNNGLTLYKISKIKKYNKWWMHNKRKKNKPIIIKIKNSINLGYMIHLGLVLWKFLKKHNLKLNLNLNLYHLKKSLKLIWINHNLIKVQVKI